jgi:hypothetical protein
LHLWATVVLRLTACSRLRRRDERDAGWQDISGSPPSDLSDYRRPGGSRLSTSGTVPSARSSRPHPAQPAQPRQPTPHPRQARQSTAASTASAAANNNGGQLQAAAALSLSKRWKVARTDVGQFPLRQDEALIGQDVVRLRTNAACIAVAGRAPRQRKTQSG